MPWTLDFGALKENIIADLKWECRIGKTMTRPVE